MVISSGFRMEQHRDDDHQEDAPHFNNRGGNLKPFSMEKMVPQFDAFVLQVGLNTSLIWGSEFFARDKIFWKFLIIIQIFTTQPMLKTFIILPLKIVIALKRFSGHFLPSTHCILDQYCSLSSFESVTDNLETIKNIPN